MMQIKSELAKIRKLPTGKRLSYLWDYYRIHFFLILFFLVFFFFFLFPLFSQPKKNTILSLAIIDSSQTAKSDTSALNEMILDHLGENSETEKVQIDTSGTTYDSSSSSTIKTAILLSSVGENDIVICGKDLYEQYAKENAFLSPASLGKKLSPAAASAVDENAVDLSSCKKWSALGYTDYTPVYLCIPVSCKHPELAADVLNFLFSD